MLAAVDKNLKVKVTFSSPKSKNKLLQPILMRDGRSSGIELLIESKGDGESSPKFVSTQDKRPDLRDESPNHTSGIDPAETFWPLRHSTLHDVTAIISKNSHSQLSTPDTGLVKIKKNSDQAKILEDVI